MNETLQRPLRIAVGTDDGITSDVRFGELSRIDVYEFLKPEQRFLYKETRYATADRGIPEEEGDKAHECKAGNGKRCQDESSLSALAGLIRDCEYLLVQKVGVKASRVLLREGISVLEKGGNIHESLLLLSSYVTKHK